MSSFTSPPNPHSHKGRGGIDAKPWRLLLQEDVALPAMAREDRAGEAAWNMALDEAILEAVGANAAPPTLRLYGWERPAVTLGRFQNVARTLCEGACAERRIPLVRRITGGRGILHGDDLTLGLIAPLEALGLAGDGAISPAAIYARISPGLAQAFAGLGIPAESGKDREEHRASIHGDCFAFAGRADLVAVSTGRKLLGAALHRRERWVLMQASVPYRKSATLQALRAELFRGQAAEPEFDANFDRSALSKALLAGLGEVLAVSWQRGVLTLAEEKRTRELVRRARG